MKTDTLILNDFRRSNINELENIHLSMFEYSNLPETVDPRYLERFLQLKNESPDGRVAWFRLNAAETSPGFPEGSLIVAAASFGRDLNPYGEGTEVIAITHNGHERRFESRYSDDVVVGFNNINETPCYDIEVDAELMSEVDLSLEYLNYYTRLYPLIKVADEKEKEKVLFAFRNMKIGEPLTIIDKPLLEELGQSSSITSDTLTNPELSRNIQFLSKFREDLKRWHLTKYGQTINGGSKLAQESVDEVNGTVSASLILPLDMLAARRKMVEEVNRKFGTDITVDFSGAWRAEVTHYEELSGEDEIDNTETDPEGTDNPENGTTKEPGNAEEVKNDEDKNNGTE